MVIPRNCVPKKYRFSTSRFISYSNLTKAGPQASVGKANQNYVKFWYEAEQTGPTRLSLSSVKSELLKRTEFLTLTFCIVDMLRYQNEIVTMV